MIHNAHSQNVHSEKEKTARFWAGPGAGFRLPEGGPAARQQLVHYCYIPSTYGKTQTGDGERLSERARRRLGGQQRYRAGALAAKKNRPRTPSKNFNYVFR